jgi:hypothetical protein
MLKKAILAAVLVLFGSAALAQSVPNGTIVIGQVWTPAQWNLAWASKADLSIFATPPPIGITTPNTGAFTGLSASGSALLGSGWANYIIGTGAAPGGGPTIRATGTDINITIRAIPKGTGVFEALRGSFGTANGSPALFDGTTPLFVEDNPTYSSTSANAMFRAMGDYAGTITNTGQMAWNLFDGIDSTTASSANSVTNLANYYTVTNSKGSRIAQQISFDIGPTDDAAGNTAEHQGLGLDAVVNGNLGGTSGNYGGNLWGEDITATLTGAATYVNSNIGLEVDNAALAGSSLQYKIGISSILQGADAVDPTTILGPSSAFMVGLNQDSPASNGWGVGLQFGNGQGWWPMNRTTGIMIYASPLQYPGGRAITAAEGIDFSAVTFSTAFLKSAGFLVDGSGNTTTHTLIIGGTTSTPAHISTAQTTAPALTSCGTSPAISGTDTAGQVTMGTTATGCVITFNAAYVNPPYCTVTWMATPLASQSYAVSATAITLTQTSTSSDAVVYHCIARAGG